MSKFVYEYEFLVMSRGKLERITTGSAAADNRFEADSWAADTAKLLTKERGFKVSFKFMRKIPVPASVVLDVPLTPEDLDEYAQ